jgi:hypothetical protein
VTTKTVWQIIMHPFDSMGRWADERLFKGKTEGEILAEEMEKAQREAQGAARVIRDHMYHEHMARARIKALEDWNHQRNLLCTVQSVPPTEGS